MSEIKNGGPVFPISPGDIEGMSLRDWFAGKALPSVMDATALLAQSGGTVYDDDGVADVCYKMADALLKRRLK